MFKNIFKSGIGIIISQLLNFAFIPILSRIYSPREYGEYAVFLAFYIVFSSVATLRLSDAIVLLKNKEETRQLIWVCFISGFFVSLVSFTIYGVWTQFDVIALLMLGSVLLSAMHKILCNFFVKQGWFLLNSLGLGLLSISWALCQFTISFIGIEKNSSLIIGHFIGILLTVVILSFIASTKYKIDIGNKVSYKEIKQVVKTYYTFIVYLTPYSLLGGLRQKVIYWYISNPAILGYLNQSERIANAPTALISSAIRPVVYKDVSDYGMQQTQRNRIRGLILLIATLCIPIVIKLFVYREVFIVFVLGDKWVQMSDVFGYLLLPTLMLLCTNWLDRILDATKKQRIGLLLELSCLLAILFACVLQTMGILTDNQLVLVYAIILVLYALIWQVVVYIVYGFGMKNLIKDITAIIAIGVVFSSLVLSLYSPNEWISNIIYILSYVVIVLVITKNFIKLIRA